MYCDRWILQNYAINILRLDKWNELPLHQIMDEEKCCSAFEIFKCRRTRARMSSIYRSLDRSL